MNSTLQAASSPYIINVLVVVLDLESRGKYFDNMQLVWHSFPSHFEKREGVEEATYLLQARLEYHQISSKQLADHSRHKEKKELLMQVSDQ